MPVTHKKVFRYIVELPDGREVRTWLHHDCGDNPIATAWMHKGKLRVRPWRSTPAWEGDLGRLKARRWHRRPSSSINQGVGE
jgi:hypothetical protein